MIQLKKREQREATNKLCQVATTAEELQVDFAVIGI